MRLNYSWKKDKNTIYGITEKMKILSFTSMVTKQELLQQSNAKQVIKFKMLNVAGEMLIQ